MEKQMSKLWHTQSAKHRIAFVLIIDGVSFQYTEKDGIVFTATQEYVEKLIVRMVSCFGCSLKPII